MPPQAFVPPPGIGTPPLMPQMPVAGMGPYPPMIPPFSVPPPGFGGFGPPGPPGATSGEQWSEHKAPDGRTYYYNSVTKQSSWQKPDQLKTPAEVRKLLEIVPRKRLMLYCFSCSCPSVLGRSIPPTTAKYITITSIQRNRDG